MNDWFRKKEISENKNPKKVADIVEKILNFNKQIRGKGIPLDLARVAKVSDNRVADRKCIKILTPKNASKITNSTCTCKSRKKL